MRAILIAVVILVMAAIPARAEAGYHLGIHGVEKTHHWWQGPTVRERKTMQALTPKLHEPHVHEPHIKALEPHEHHSRKHHHATHHESEHQFETRMLRDEHEFEHEQRDRAIRTEHARKRNAACTDAEIKYRLRHGMNTPNSLIGLHGCELWETDARYHAKLHEPSLPTVRDLILETD